MIVGLVLKIACFFHQNITFIYKVTRTGCGSPLQQYLKPSLNFLLFKVQLLISSKFITVAPPGSQELLKLGVLPKNIFLIPNGIELPPKKNFLKWNDRKNVYVVIGRAIKRKRLTHIINAWLEAGRDKSAELCVIGDGPELLKLTRFYGTDLKQNNITFLGHLDQEDIMKILLRAKYYVSASVSEGLSNSLLEAMAFGLVPIVRKMPENEFVVEHKNNGYLFSNEDDLCRLFSMKNKMEGEDRLSLNALSTVRKCFDIRIIAVRYQQVLNELVLKSRGKI
jgi:glycosyltransferase involved in cell wall biosynthesis